jgi:HSP20 family molecular chaperone IbpA
MEGSKTKDGVNFIKQTTPRNSSSLLELNTGTLVSTNSFETNQCSDVSCEIYAHNFENIKNRQQSFASSTTRIKLSDNIMSLLKFRPFALRTPFGEVFDMPAFPFPRELANIPNFNTFESDEGFWHSRHPYQVQEDDKMYTVSVDVPGVRAEDMNIKIEDNNVLHLSGGRKINEGKTFPDALVFELD